MKKTIVVVSLLLIMCLLTGCFGGDVELINSTVEVTLVDAEDTEVVTVKTGSFFQIEPPAKSGYLFLGYYDSESGGEQYVNGNGRSVSKWKKGFPTTVYAQWKDISEIHWESKAFYSSEPKDIGGSGGTTIECKFSEDLAAAILGNPGKYLKVNLTCKAKYVSNHKYPMKVRILDTDMSGYEVLGSKEHALSTEYQSYDMTFTIKAEDVDSGKIYINIDNNSISYWVCMYVKDIKVKVAFE